MPGAEPASLTPVGRAAAIAQISGLLDRWHAAAARSDLEAYVGALDEDAVFRGTDDSERWDRESFRAYAAPHFAAGKGWSFTATRRAIQVSPDGQIGWFDEDLYTPNLGPVRGSGVVVQRPEGWRIAHYNLSVSVPNDHMDDVKQLLAGAPLPSARCQPSTSAGRPRRKPPPPRGGDIIDPWR
jgi:hypothetical protein